MTQELSPVTTVNFVARMVNEGLNNEEVVQEFNKAGFNLTDLVGGVRHLLKQVPDMEAILRGVEEFDLEQLSRFCTTIDSMQRQLNENAKCRMVTASAEQLLPNWSCYSDTPQDVIDDLNRHGVALIEAIRSDPMSLMRERMQKLMQAQRQYAICGADDTEGREATWDLVQNACLGTDHDPNDVWDYTRE